MGRPINEVEVDDAMRRALHVNVNNHVGVFVVARRTHHVMLRAEAVREVVPLVLVPRNDELDVFLISL